MTRRLAPLLLAVALAACGDSTRSLPLGTYRTRIPARELVPSRLADSLGLGATDWTVEFNAKGQYAVQLNGGPVSEGDFRVSGDTLFLENEIGEFACHGHRGGRYQWEASGDTLRLSRLEDACEPRSQIFSKNPLTREPD